MSVFGPLRQPGEMEEAVRLQLKKWMPTYISRLGEVGSKSLVPPKSYSIVSEYDKWPEQALPAVVVESAGLVEPPEQDGEGYLTGKYSVEVTVAVQGKDALSTRNLAMNHGVAVIGVLMQHRKLSEGVWVNDHIDMAFAGASAEQRRTRVAVANVFHVTLENFLNVSEGPTEVPEELPADDLPTVTSTETEVEKES